MNTKIAVLIATYNGEKYIKELLDSLKMQTEKDFCCYIHDDGSSDATMEILSKYKNNNDLNITILDYPPTGSAKANFISLLNYINEPYAMFCDQDDIWECRKIEVLLNQIELMEKEHGSDCPIMIFSDLKVVDESLHVIDESFMHFTGKDPYQTKVNNLLVTNVIPGCSSIMNRSLYELAGKCSNIDNIMMHDHYVALIASCDGLIDYCSTPLILYRQHNNNQLGAEQKIGTVDRMRIIWNLVKKGTYVNGIKEWHSAIRLQAGEVANVIENKGDNYYLCKEFSMIGERDKITRVRFIKGNHISKGKNGWWFLLWC